MATSAKSGELVGLLAGKGVIAVFGEPSGLRGAAFS
jgi:hypothetical protein